MKQMSVTNADDTSHYVRKGFHCVNQQLMKNVRTALEKVH